MMGYMDKYDISPKNIHSSQHKNSTKVRIEEEKNLTASHFQIKCQVNIISMAKDFSTYFSRIYPVASNDQEVKHQDDLQYLVVSHCYSNNYNFLQLFLF